MPTLEKRLLEEIAVTLLNSGRTHEQVENELGEKIYFWKSARTGQVISAIIKTW